MKIGTAPLAVQYGAVLIAWSVPVTLAGFYFAGLVEWVLGGVLTPITAVAMVVGG